MRWVQIRLLENKWVINEQFYFGFIDPFHSWNNRIITESVKSDDIDKPDSSKDVWLWIKHMQRSSRRSRRNISKKKKRIHITMKLNTSIYFKGESAFSIKFLQIDWNSSTFLVGSSLSTDRKMAAHVHLKFMTFEYVIYVYSDIDRPK